MWIHRWRRNSPTDAVSKAFRVGCHLVLVCLTAAMLGCGDGEEYVPVGGTVSLNGEPLPDAKLIFEPIGDESGIAPGKPSYGRTDKTGHYTLICPIAKADGAAVGKHRVRIVTTKAAEYTPEQLAAARKKLKQDEAAGGNSTAKISDERVRQFLSDVIQPQRREMLPARYNARTELTFTVGPDGADQADFSLETP